MTPTLLLHLTVNPVLEWLSAAGVRSDDRARVLMLAIAGQESGLRHRVQVGGPARGLWQFERGGGVAGVLRHEATRGYALAACDELLVPTSAETVHAAIAQNDALAAVFARLLLLSDPRRLPDLDQPGEAWDYYIRCWRPGKPHPHTWDVHWQAALRAVQRPITTVPV